MAAEARVSPNGPGAAPDASDFHLIARASAQKRFTDIVFSDSHGAFDGFLGCGYLYYGFAAAIRSQISVCIGSGGGFVPDLLAQAQRDLQISPAATYLVDANLPDLGFGSPVQDGGWLHESNDFTERARDITILQMLSADAATLFFKQGLTIDYLHIDGDHSTRGVVADFESFAPLLSERAVVSFHDLSMPSVQSAMDAILAQHANWECLQLIEVGVGTAFLRRRPSGPAQRLPETSAAFVDQTRRVGFSAPAEAEKAVAESRKKAQFERWGYLSTSAYRIRYLIAAELIDNPGGAVVEIGGFPNSSIDFLFKSARLIAVEPYAPKEFLDTISATAKSKGIDFFVSRQSVAETPIEVENLANFNLLWLGMDISAGVPTKEEYCNELVKSLRIVSRAKMSVVELSEHVPSAMIWRLICACLKPTIIRDVKLDLTQDPVADAYFVKDGRARRRVVAFTTQAALNDDHSAKIEQCAEDLLAIRLRVETAGRSDDGAGVYRFAAAELPANLGTINDNLERCATAAADAKGCFTFGPYVKLRAGAYQLVLTYAGFGEKGRAPDDWDVCVGVHSTIARGRLACTEGVMSDAEGEFTISEEQASQPVEIRTFFAAAGDLTIRRVEIRRLP